MAEFDEALKKEVHRLHVNVYNDLGMVYSTTLHAPSKEKLKEKKAEIILEHSPNAEVITFSNHSVERIYSVAEESLDETQILVDEITNPYAKPYFSDMLKKK